MNVRSRQQRLTVALVGACVSLASIIGLEIVFSDRALHKGEVPLESVVPETTGLPRFVAQPYREFEQILARPLFYEARRLPPAAMEQAPQTAPLEPLRLTLEGVAIGGGSRIAVLRDDRGREQIRLAEGMSHNGWVLESVKSAGAEFRRGADVAALELEVGESPRRRARRR